MQSSASKSTPGDTTRQLVELDELEAEIMGDLGLIESARLTKLPTNRIKGNAAKNL